jgi:hypothetical protein
MSIRHCMTRRSIVAGVITVIASAWQATTASAGPCSQEIAQFDRAMQQSAGDPYAGLTAVQTTGAQLDRQPTPASIARAEKRMKSRFTAELRRAKRADTKNDSAGCNHALADAKRMYILK